MSVRSQVLIVLFCWFSLPAFAQQGAPTGQVTAKDEQPAAPAPSADRRITLDVAVTDHSGKIVSGLNQQDFTLIDNKQAQTAFSFRAVDGTSKLADPPTQVILLVDAINTPFQGVAFQRTQLEKFLRQNGGELPLPTSLVMMTDTSAGGTASTQDGNTLADALNSEQSGLRAIGRSQGFYGGVDRVQRSIGSLEQIISSEANQPGRKLLIWLGPGWPLLSGRNVELTAKVQQWLFQTAVSLSTELRQARITLYNINPLGVDSSFSQAFYYEGFLKGVPSANKMQNGNLALQVLAVQSGGRVLNRDNDIINAISTCLMDTKAFYVLAFDPPAAAHPNEYHNLQIKMSQPGLTGRTRTGYYAQP